MVPKYCWMCGFQCNVVNLSETIIKMKTELNILSKEQYIAWT